MKLTPELVKDLRYYELHRNMEMVGYRAIMNIDVQLHYIKEVKWLFGIKWEKHYTTTIRFTDVTREEYIPKHPLYKFVEEIDQHLCGERVVLDRDTYERIIKSCPEVII